MPPRSLTAVLRAVAHQAFYCGALCLFAQPAWALGLAGSSGAAVIGQPLDVTVQVRLDNGETLSAECVAAEVSFGEQRVPAQAVRATVEGAGTGAGSANAARIRVNTSAAVDEPVVDVLVSAGCGVRVSRRYLVLAANPNGAAPASQTVIVRPVSIAPPADTAATAGIAAATAAATAAAAAPAVVAGGTTKPATLAPLRPAPRPATAIVAPAAQSAAPVRSRLRMDFADDISKSSSSDAEAEAVGIEQAMQAVAEAASAARAIAEAASAANQRAANLELTVQQLRKEAQGQLDVNTRLRQQLERTDNVTRWTWLLALTSAALLALCMWLWQKLRKLQRQKSIQPGNDSALSSRAGPTSRQAAAPSSIVASETGPDTMAGEPPRTDAGVLDRGRATVPAKHHMAPAFSPAETWLPTLEKVVDPASLARPAAAAHVDAPESAVERTDPSLQSLQGARLALRDVSIEELIDLEQQADFFVALDQDDAAIGLLADHLRQTAGASPLPYLKLLEIYRRRGDRNDYERTRVRFNQRFNAYAPEWHVDLQSGRNLEDYPGILPRLCEVWPQPLDSMAELEALLFRKSRGEMFELPAYREVLFLYALARDLLEREASTSGKVDVLLPIASPAAMASASAFSPTAPVPFLELGKSTPRDALPLPDTPGAPLDFDISVDHGHKASIFDPLSESPQALRRP
jgi:pilus assembly protein FimV